MSVRNGFCNGCGCYWTVNGVHRADCTGAYPKNGQTTAEWHAAYLLRVQATAQQ